MNRIEIIDTLNKLYPDKVVKQLSYNTDLYNELRSICLENKIMMVDYLNELGFKFPAKMKYSEKDIEEQLNFLFPRKKYNQISEFSHDSKLYNSIRSYAKFYDLKIEDYLTCLGFDKVTHSLYTEEEISEKLESIFPEHKYSNLTKTLNDIDYKLYTSIRNKANELNIRSSEYLEQLGFREINTNKTTAKIDYDIYNIKKLISEYRIHASGIADLLDCSRENIRQKLDKKQNDFCKDNWLIPFTEEDISIICNTLESTEYHTTHQSHDFSFSIIPSKAKGNENRCLLMRINHTVKLTYKLPDKISALLKSQFLDLYSNEELDFFNTLETIWLSNGKHMEKGLKSVTLDSAMKSKLDKFCAFHNTDRLSYLEINDFIYENRMKSMTDEEIKRLISLYVTEGNKIEIHTTDPHYHVFWARAEHSGLTYKEFFKKYGFDYERSRVSKSPERKDRITAEIIRERYVVKDNIIYISSYDPFYRTITNLSQTRGLSINDYLRKLGFSRFENVKDLPSGYTPYDFTNELANSGFLNEERISEALSLISNQANEVYLIVDSYLYYLIFLRTKIEKLDITGIVERLGFKRVFDKSLFENFNEQQKAVEELLEEQTSSDMVSYFLNKLNEIENEYKEISSNETRLERNRKLVSTLKDLYKGKCQVCGDDCTIPPICLADGSLYSEVHHITNFHEAKSSDDLEEIDNYRNAIVLCAHHHKYVHYNAGGEYKLSSDDSGNLCLENNTGDKLPIRTNYHLAIEDNKN